MHRLLIWLSGADRNLLAKCKHLLGTEQQRFAGYGGLVLIPATVGLVAMGYAAFTFVPRLSLAIAGGVVWSAIILWVDRFLAMTLHKSALHNFWGGFLVRLMLAGTIGYGLAHPLMLLLFQGPIEQEMADEGRARQEAAFEQANSIKAVAFERFNQARSENTRDLATELDRKTKLWECTSTLVSMEQAKGVASGTPARDRDGNICGVASGEEGCKARCRLYLQERDQLGGEIDALRQQIQARLNAFDAGGVALDVTHASQYANQLEQQVASEKSPTDYAARTRALAAVEVHNPEIRSMRIFLVVFLVILDTLVVSLKVVTPRGEYEEVRDSALSEARAVAQAQRATTVSWANSHYQNLVQARLRHETHKNEIDALLGTVNDALQEQAEQFRQFELKMRALYENVQRVKNNEDRQIFAERLADIRRAYGEAWAKALDRFRTYIRTL